MNEPSPADRTALDARLAALPLDVAPARDLWPDIAGSIAAADVRPVTARWRWPLALAAGVAVAAIAGALGWQAGRQNAAPLAATPAAGTAGDPLVQASFALPEGHEYRATRAALERSYRERLELLAPATRGRLEEDLAAIRHANADIRSALAADPQSAVLNRLLESTWQQEFDLYATVTHNTDPAVPRTRT